MDRRQASETQQRSWAVWLVLGCAVTVSVATPILTLDTDLWYHLRHGRVIAETSELPADTSFSFLRPVRPFVDYYWLFQVVCHVVFQLTGYTGLIALRTLCIAAILLAARHVLLGGDTGGRGAPMNLAAAVALGLVALAILPRALGFRPHDFTYAFLAICLAALSQRRTPIWLPLVAVTWVNFHGVTYPVLLAIVGAFGADLAWDIATGRRSLHGSTRRAALLGAMVLAPLLTPHGLSLLATPFRFSAGASRIIRELRPPDPAALLHWQLDLLAPYGPVFATLLFWLLPWLLWRAHHRGGIRLSRWLLVATGIYLFHRAGRFQVELVLLSLPLLADALSARPGCRPGVGRLREGGPGTWAAAALVCLSLSSMAVAGWRLPHPLGDRGELPRGVVAFLAEHGEGGRILHPAGLGGYLLGSLDDRFRITMDLELPFAFAVEDYDQVTHSLYDERVLAAFLTTYEPEFVAAGNEQSGFAARLRQVAPHYRPVFVDDALALWASERSRPQLVAAWELRAVDIERLLTDPGYLPKDAALAAAELDRMVEQAPQTRNAGRLLVRLLLAARKVPEALQRAEALAAIPGPQVTDLQLLGDARAVSGDDLGAIAALKRALELAPASDSQPLHRRLAYLNLRRGQAREAYDHLRRVVDVDRPRAPADDVRLLARLAREVGEDRHSEQLLRSLEWRTLEPRR